MIMFGLFKKIETPAQADLRNELVLLRKKYENLSDAYERLLSDARDTEVEFDFNAVKVFSIERIPDHDIRTVIGYMVPTNEGGECVREWVLRISDRRHNELVNRFREWKAKKK